MDLTRHWRLDPAVEFLNHGSFGACPGPVLDEQAALRDRLERQPVDFFVRQYGELLDEARSELARFLSADPGGLVPVPNATTGVNAVLRSLELREGDELLTTDHAYNACRNALDFVAGRSGARVNVVRLPFPLHDPAEVANAVLDAVTPRTRLVLIDHITSPTGVVLPLETILAGLRGLGVDALVDGAHAPGLVPLELDRQGAAYYVGNCHKWLCAPKGAGFLWVREDLREAVRPVTISHGATRRRPGRTRFHDEFDWTGTHDPTPFLCVPAAIRFMGSLLEGGWNAVREHNHRLVLLGRRALTRTLGIAPPCPDEMIGSLATVPVPPRSPDEPTPGADHDPLQVALVRRHRIEVPVFDWPSPERRWLRISAQVYNRPEQYERLADALATELRR